MKKRITALILTFIMVRSVCPVMADAEDYASRLYTVEQFIYAIGTNNLEGADEANVKFTDWNDIDEDDKETLKIASANGIISGYEDGTIRPYDKVLRIEAFVMLSRALDNLTMVTEPLAFSDTPVWAKSYIDRLSAAGLVKGMGDGTLGAEDYITQEQVLILADRIDQIYTTTELEDDYYATANAKWLRNNTVPPSYISWSTAGEASKRTDDAIKEIVTSYAKEPQGSTRRSVYNYYQSALDMDKRNADGIAPIKPYLDMLDAARTKTDIIEVMANIAKDNYMFSLIPVSIAPDELNTDEMLITLYSADTGMGAYYLIEDKDAQKAYKEYLMTLFKLAGEENRRLEDRIDAVINLKKTIAAAGLNYYEYMEFENRYNEYTPETFNSAFYNIDLELYFNTIGIPVPQRFIVEEVRQMNVINSFLTDDSVPLVRDYIKSILLKDCADFLSQDFLDAQDKYNRTFYAVEGDTEKEDSALYTTDSMWGMVIGMDYLDRYYSPSTTKAIDDMTHELIATYEERIKNLDWLSDDTKASAIKKLETIGIKIGGPSGYPEFMDKADIPSPDEGGNLFNSTAKLSALSLQSDIEALTKGYDRGIWSTTPHTVNAYYSPIRNEIVLPAGILQEPFYSPDNSYEENLGAIGSIIAHELSHAFDSSGAQYDEKGNFKNWWTDEDFQEFEELSKSVAERYSKIEVLKGQFVNGDYTLNENIADLGAMSCIIGTAKKHKGVDFDKMFRSYAHSWAEITPDKNLITQLLNDNHSPAKVRVNGVLQNFELFYETYGIDKDDGMYLPPDERVYIW